MKGRIQREMKNMHQDSLPVYKYETHLHTSEASACAHNFGKEMVRAYASAGYQGIIVTDHFFNGNTCVPCNLPWKERVELFCRGFENAREEGAKCGLQVFFGFEYGYYHTDFLTYGLDKQYLLDNPDILSWGLSDYADRVHLHGGFITHAHPFREESYIDRIRLMPELIDAVEVYNGGNRKKAFNSRALQYADDNGLPYTSGSDSHAVDQVLGGIASYTRLESVEDYIRLISSGQGYEIIQK